MWHKRRSSATHIKVQRKYCETLLESNHSENQIKFEQGKKRIKWAEAVDFQKYKKFDQVCVIAQGHERIKNIKLEKIVEKIYREEEIKFRLRHREHL